MPLHNDDKDDAENRRDDGDTDAVVVMMDDVRW